MNNLLTSITLSNINEFMLKLLIFVVGLVVWFFINRASLRINKQIELLELLLKQQKRQNALLLRLCEAKDLEEQNIEEIAGQSEEKLNENIHLIAER